MNRRSLAVICGLVASAVSLSAWGQSTSRPASLAERISALRQGWPGGSQQQAADETATGARSAASRGTTPQASGRSLLPNGLLGRHTVQQPSVARVPPAASGTASTRIASRPPAGSFQSPQQHVTKGFTLPGLGGSRLPSAIVSSTQSTTTGARPDSSTAHSPQVAGSTVRRSPPHRTVLNVNPKDFSRELAGSFPTSPQDIRESVVKEETVAGSEPTPAEELILRPAEERDSNASTQMEVVDRSGDAANRSMLHAAGPTVKPSPDIDRNSSARPSQTVGTPFTNAPSATPDPFNRPSVAATADTTVLASQQTPVITTDIRGPRQILVGREATYRVRLSNQGQIPAEGVVASIRIPSWADVIGTNTSQGTIQQSQDGGNTGVLEWQLVRVDRQSSETLDLRLVPRSSRPLELGVSYKVAPVGSRAVVEVQEPKLEIHVTGPDEVLYGKPQIFRMTISNPGTGPAENVKIDLMPPGGGNAIVSSHPLGDLTAGSSRTVEVELTPREAGKLSVKAHAAAEGGLAADAEKEILCRKPELEVDWRGPDEKYAGTAATYFFRVRNPGTAPAEDVVVHVTMPEGAEYAGASEGKVVDTNRRKVSWNVGTLGPGDDYYMELKCLLQSPGTNQLSVLAAASGDLTNTKTAQTNVVALADLKLDVSDPAGPVEVGEDAVYEIRVKNRGACAAHDVNVVALFPDGVEPDQVEGALYTVSDGRVTFSTIDELPAGRQIALRIRAKASQPGMHVFRAEVLCKSQEIKLAAEETTRFYSDDLQIESQSEQLQPPQQQSAEHYKQADDQQQSAERYQQADDQQQSAERYEQEEPSVVR
jgi:hypothetical protein